MAEPFLEPLPPIGDAPWNLNPAVSEVRARVADVEDFVSGPGIQDQIVAAAAELNPETLSDSFIASQISTPSQTQVAVQEEALTGGNGKRNRFQGAVIRNEGAPNYWQPLPRTTNHVPVNIDNCEIVDDGVGPFGRIKVNYGSIGADVTGTFIAVPDETLATWGYLMGSSVTPDYAEIRMAQVKRGVSDYAYYDTTSGSIVSQTGKFTYSFDSATGVITFEHANYVLDSDAQYAVYVTPRGGRYKEHTFTGTGAFTTTGGKFQLTDSGEEMLDYMTYNGTSWVSTYGVMTRSAFASGIHTFTHAAIPASQQFKHSLGARGAAAAPIRPEVTYASSALNTTQIRVELYDKDGVLITTEPPTGTVVIVSHGGGTGKIVKALDADVKFSIMHGGGFEPVHPRDITTTKHPASNMWLFGFQELPDA